jgi:hypothetical protein
MNPSPSRLARPNPGRAARTPAAAIAWTSVVLLLLVGLVALDLYRSEAAVPDPVIPLEKSAPMENHDSSVWPAYDGLPEELPSTY